MLSALGGLAALRYALARNGRQSLEVAALISAFAAAGDGTIKRPGTDRWPQATRTSRHAKGKQCARVIRRRLVIRAPGLHGMLGLDCQRRAFLRQQVSGEIPGTLSPPTPLTSSAGTTMPPRRIRTLTSRARLIPTPVEPVNPGRLQDSQAPTATMTSASPSRFRCTMPAKARRTRRRLKGSSFKRNRTRA
jgi:hypothetical protein